MDRVGVVVMAYGTPATPDDVEGYYTHIRRGRPPTPEQLANLQRRYDALGGTSTLARRTADQVAALRGALEAAHPGRFVVTLGQKHAAPFIEDAVAHLADAGVNAVVGVVLAPHYSQASVGEYEARLRAAAEPHGLPTGAVERWHDLPEYRDFLADAVTAGLAGLADDAPVAADPSRVEVVFTAHSLPERLLDHDPYPEELASSARAVAAALDLPAWSIGWQSAGATPEPWRGPDVLDVLRDRAASDALDAVLVCPQGFVADHLEVAYDLDIEAAGVAAEAGIGFARTATVNDHPAVMAALAGRIAATAEEIVRPREVEP